MLKLKLNKKLIGAAICAMALINPVFAAEKTYRLETG